MPIYSGPEITNRGLVLHLDAANSRSYPRTGTTWSDMSGQGYNGILTNSPTFSGENNGSFVFDGIDDFINFTSNITMFFNSFSIACWFKTPQSADAKIFSNSSSYHPIQTFFGVMRVCVNGCSAGTTVINDNQWRLATVVGDTTSVRLHINGNIIPEITQAATTASITSLPNIGRVGQVNQYYYAGNLSSMLIYNRALSVAEIQQNFEAHRSRFGV